MPVLKKSKATSQIRQERRDFGDGGKESFTISNPASRIGNVVRQDGSADNFDG